MQVAIEFEWEEIGSLQITEARRLLIPSVAAEPGIYRFLIDGSAGFEVYIGESVNLRNRMMRNYASTHTGVTNVRVRGILLSRLSEGKEVRLAIVRHGNLEVDSVSSTADFTHKSVRMLAENAAIVAAQKCGFTIHNL